MDLSTWLGIWQALAIGIAALCIAALILLIWLGIWQALAIGIAALCIAALILLIWLGWLDERDHPEQPTLSPRQLREAKRGNGWDRAGMGRRLPR